MEKGKSVTREQAGYTYPEAIAYMMGMASALEYMGEQAKALNVLKGSLSIPTWSGMADISVTVSDAGVRLTIKD